jgi:hypothetical protein
MTKATRESDGTTALFQSAASQSSSPNLPPSNISATSACGAAGCARWGPGRPEPAGGGNCELQKGDERHGGRLCSARGQQRRRCPTRWARTSGGRSSGCGSMARWLRTRGDRPFLTQGVHDEGKEAAPTPDQLPEALCDLRRLSVPATPSIRSSS